MQKLGCPESFTEPIELYNLALKKGMTAVTITDHNVIDGCLDIADQPNAFISCEYTTYFPEDRCKVHVLCYGLTEAQHRDLTEARENIFDFTKYCRQHNIHHSCAHPLFGVNDRLTTDHVEKLVLLYKNWEIVNGDISPDMNRAARLVIDHLTPRDIERIANKHGFIPDYPEPWRKNFTAGSDDHSSLHLAQTYTQVPGAATWKDFWVGVEQGHSKIHSKAATPQGFARNVYGIAYQFYKSKFNLERFVNKDVFLRFLDRALQTRPETTESWVERFHLMLAHRRRIKELPKENPSLLGMARFEAERIIRSDPQLMNIMREGDSLGTLDQKWFDVVNQVSNKVLCHFGNHLLDRLVGGRIFDIFHTLGSAGALYALLAPYFVAYSHYTSKRDFSREVLDHFSNHGAPIPPDNRPAKVAHFTDTFGEVNGVARTLQQQCATAQSLGKDYTIVTCFSERQPFRRGVRQFEAVGSFSLPEYPEIRLLAPPLLPMLAYCYEENITHIHVSTPGPVGLAALAIARILKLPISGTYHTAFPQYAKALTEDAYVEEMSWRYMIWFHEQLDAVYVPSKATGAELVDKGISAEKIRVYPRGVNTERFHPSKRNDIYRTQFGIDDDLPLMLYVGRVSKEKNLDLLCKGYQLLLEQGYEARLVVTGDGPYRKEMERLLAGTPALFTGYMKGDELTSLYASSDLLVFPSTTDTFGNVVLEAQASGVPVIVSDQGGPHENVDEGKTGLIVSDIDGPKLAQAMATLLDDRPRREAMGRAGRAYMETRSFAKAFEQLYRMYVGEEISARSAADLKILMAALNQPDVLATS